MKSRLTGRQLKKTIFALLQQPDFNAGIQEICRFPYRQVVNPLFSFLYSLDDTIKWRAVSAMGAVIARLAEEELESARIVMRRFIWNLNDESGGIGWGSPEAMGETMALSKTLADEYAAILVSYIRPDGNYLEHEDLQSGVLWGIGRLAHARPARVSDAAPFLCAYMESGRPVLARAGRMGRHGSADRPHGCLLEGAERTTGRLSEFIGTVYLRPIESATWLPVRLRRRDFGVVDIELLSGSICHAIERVKFSSGPFEIRKRDGVIVVGGNDAGAGGRQSNLGGQKVR